MANSPRGWNPLIGVGFTALGVGYLYEAFKRDPTPTPVGGNMGWLSLTGTPVAKTGLPEQQNAGQVLVVKDGIRSIKFYPAGNIDNRLKFIIDQIRKDSQDPKTVTEARAIVSGKCKVERGGVDWCLAPKDWLGELKMLFWALTNPNSPYAMRYTRDHATVDMFGSSESHRRLPAGDCFVHGTLVLRDDHKLVPVETLRVGDRIWGFDKWTSVMQTWEKGILPTWLIRLNNGSSMRLTPDHKVWVVQCKKHPTGANCTQASCPTAERSRQVVRVKDLRPGMVVLQPDKVDAGADQVDPEEAWIEGVFAADGWIDGKTRFAIAGKDGHPKEAQKRRVQAFFEARGIATDWQSRYIRVYSREWVDRLSALGRGAVNKRLSSLAYNAAAVEQLTEGVMADASAVTRNEKTVRCLTTTSRDLFLQMRVLMKIRGVTCGERFIADHGGLGKNPIWRLQERLGSDDKERGVKLLRVKEIVRDNLALPCFDFATEDQCIWLPEADWTVHNCDDFAIRLGALARAIGYPVKCRIVAPAGQPGAWAHIYLMVGSVPGEGKPPKWLPMDPTEAQHGPFWEVPRRLISSVKDYEV